MLYHVHAGERAVKFMEGMTAQHSLIFTAEQAITSTKGASDRLLEGLAVFVARAVASGAKEVYLFDYVLDHFDEALGERVAECVKPLLDKGIEIHATTMHANSPIVIALRSAAKSAGYKTKITTTERKVKKRSPRINVLDFILSGTVRQYLKRIGYAPSPLEKAFIVWQCKNKVLAEKHAAFREIIATTDDCAIPASDWRESIPSLHAHLEKHMAAEQAQLDAFYQNENAVYTYSLCFANEVEWLEDHALFSSFDNCWQAACEDFDIGTLKAIRVEKRLLDTQISSVWVDFSPEKEVVAVSTEDDHVFAEDLIDECFEGLHLPIPLPFKNGDTLVPAERKLGPPSSFEDDCVFDGIDERNYAWGFFTDANGNTVREQIIHPLNHEIQR